MHTMKEALSEADKPLPLNQGQQEAADAFFQFLFSEDDEFIISGPGGVGKTFLMGHLIDIILPRYFETCQLMGIPPQYDAVEMTATTNKAAAALGLATKRPTSTIHSFLNLKVKDDYATGKSKLERTGAWVVHERRIAFIDESSMIDDDLDLAAREGLHKSKKVYVGDHCQLAPVMMKLSPIYRRPIPFYQLTEPMRNSGQPALMALCNQLRNTVETGEFHPIKIVPGVIDYLDDDQMQQELAQRFQNMNADCRVLAYTNNRVNQFNDFIRQTRNLPPEFIIGERVVNNTALPLRQRMISVEEELTVVGSANKTELIEVGDGATLEVRRMTFDSSYGERFHDLPVPVDREHYQSLIKYFKGRKMWPKMFDLKNKYPDFRPREASTVYKAQGSTYDTVFIDLGDISTCRDANQAARMLYVAVSRPKTRIFLYGQLADKYGGLTY